MLGCLVTGRRRVVSLHLLLLTALLAAARAAGDKDSDCANEAKNGSGKNKPDTDRPAGSGISVAVDSSSDDGEASKVTGQSDDSDNEGSDGDES